MENIEKIKFNSAKNKFEEVYNLIKEAIESYENINNYNNRLISQSDYINLKKYYNSIRTKIPERNYFETVVEEKSSFLQKLKKAFTIKQKTKNKGTEKIEEKVFPSSYILIEDCDSALQELIKCDEKLNLTRPNEDEIVKMLDIEPSGHVTKITPGGTSILDDYRQEKWGVDRICLDGMQNHLPEDAKGTHAFLHFKVNGKWVDCETAKIARDKGETITEVRFADDGVGFSKENLLFLHSTKTAEEKSVGEFGEGMKLASMASVNLGLDMEFQSQNWRAFAVGEDVNIENTRNNTIEQRKRLVYDIAEYDGPPIKGSRTIFHNPTEEFLNYALELPQKILQLDSNYTPVLSTEYGDIVSCKNGGNIYVKGVFVTRDDSLSFSYNFNDAKVNPDRNALVNFDLKSRIYNIIDNMTDKKTIKTIIARVADITKNNGYNTYQDYYTLPAFAGAGNSLAAMFKYQRGVPSLWEEAFKELFENKEAVREDGSPIEAILKTDYEVPEELKSYLDKYNIVTLPEGWTKALHLAGIKTDRESLPEFIKEDITTSLTLDYGKDKWGLERIILDACQNHLPSDSGGSRIELRFQTKDGEWHEYTEFTKYKNDDIQKIKFSDDGRGYDYKKLGIFMSDKDHESSSGKWGEGLKMISAAALRSGIKMELHSREWIATPYAKTENIDGKETNQLCFSVIKQVHENSKIIDDGDHISEVSSTIFSDPTSELINEFRNIHEKVLPFYKESYFFRTSNSDIPDVISLSEGKLFVRDLLIPGDHPLKYSYHFKNHNIGQRDRHIIDEESIKEELSKLFKEIGSKYFIGMFLRDAAEYAMLDTSGHSKQRYLEFETPFEIDDNLADIWIKTFKEIYGKRGGVRFASDQDENAIHQAKHVNINIVTLPDCVARALMSAKTPEGEVIESYKKAIKESTNNVEYINEDELTQYEKNLINYLLHIGKDTLALDPDLKGRINSIRVFKYPENYNGFKTSGFASKGDAVNIERRTLNDNLARVAEVFFHETTHGITGALDAETAFRDFLARFLGLAAMDKFPLSEFIEDNSKLLKGVRSSEIVTAAEKLKKEMEQNPFIPRDNNDRYNNDLD